MFCLPCKTAIHFFFVDLNPATSQPHLGNPDCFSGIFRSSHLQMFFKIGVLKNFAIFKENICVGVSFLKRTAFYIEHLCWLFLNFLQNLLKITVKKIISQWSFSQKCIRNSFLVLAAMFLKITPLQVSSQFLYFFKHVRGIFRTQLNIKMVPFAKIVNSSRGIFRTESNI